ncbi:MAG: ATP-NAD kinase family protein [Methanoregulaceae archaeon]|jgi:predicted polyphosphate/ATP-dependent NAD kinase|nr:ATP-NAD kinase family protein [Methanoregulaceae archaeon]
MRCIGFLINPVAGMGGAVGLKGTDGNVEEARRRGAVPLANNRAHITLSLLAVEPGIRFITCSGQMGEEALIQAGVKDYRVVYHYMGESRADDTRQAAVAFKNGGAELVLFCGGDGTARDVFDSTGRELPILGIPAGVKMYSAVFAIDPATAAELISGYDVSSFRDSEIMDVDEEAYRAGELKTRLYGIARTPVRAGKVQLSKQVFEEADEERAKGEIARFIHEIMIPDVLYILGAGTTTEAIARETGVKKTLLGIDVIKNGETVASDINEQTLWDLLLQGVEAKILISPIGAQGFILGRGNQQISPRVVRKVGPGNIIVVATPHKLRETPLLYVDSGDSSIDAAFGDTILVVSGYRMAQRKRLYQHPRGQKS